MKLRNRLKQLCHTSIKSNTSLRCELATDRYALTSIERHCGRMTPSTRDILIRSRATTCLLALVAATSLLLSTCALASGQYGGSGYSHYQHGGGAGGYESSGYEHGEMDERPKVNLGIRLRIPAFKFELPRFSLPKITVSAKIRNPDGPRVITLPEINLDTSSKVEPPNSGKSAANQYGSDYSTSATNYHKPSPSYGRHTGQDVSQVFSFSTDEEKHAPSPSSNSYPSSPSRYYSQAAKPAQITSYHRFQQQQQQQQQQPQQSPVQSYKVSGSQVSGQYAGTGPNQAWYAGYGRAPSTGRGTNYYQRANGVQAVTRATTSANYYDSSAGKSNADLGFNSPVYVDPLTVASASRNTGRNQ